MKPILKVNLKWSEDNLHKYGVEPALGEQNPKEIMLSSLGSCTGLTLLVLLQKMRLDVEAMKIEVIGEFTDNPPKAESPFTKFNTKIEIKSRESKEYYGRFAHAATLTHDTHCGVNLMMQKIAPALIELYVNGDKIEL